MADLIDTTDPRVLALARARQQLAHRAGFLPRPTWEQLTEQERTLSLLDARNYLRAAAEAGLLHDSEVPADADQMRAELEAGRAERADVADRVARVHAVLAGATWRYAMVHARDVRAALTGADQGPPLVDVITAAIVMHQYPPDEWPDGPPGEGEHEHAREQAEAIIRAITGQPEPPPGGAVRPVRVSPLETETAQAGAPRLLGDGELAAISDQLDTTAFRYIAAILCALNEREFLAAVRGIQRSALPERLRRCAPEVTA